MYYHIVFNFAYSKRIRLKHSPAAKQDLFIAAIDLLHNTTKTFLTYIASVKCINKSLCVLCLSRDITSTDTDQQTVH